MTALASRRALLGWLMLGLALAGCASRRELYRASRNSAETPADWFFGRGCDRVEEPRYRRPGRRGRHDRDGTTAQANPCPDYRSAGEGYPDTHGGSLPPPLPRGPARRPR